MCDLENSRDGCYPFAFCSVLFRAQCSSFMAAQLLPHFTLLKEEDLSCFGCDGQPVIASE